MQKKNAHSEVEKDLLSIHILMNDLKKELKPNEN